MRKLFDAAVRPGATLLLAVLICVAALPVQALAARADTGCVAAAPGEGRGRTRNVSVQTQAFTESNKDLKNPDRGFYSIYCFLINDEGKDPDGNRFVDLVRNYGDMDSESALVLVEINLKNYRDGDISDAGLENIDNLLGTWSQSGKRVILRFLYDWDGKNLVTEPESLDTVLRHIEQVGDIVKKHADAIFTLQGLFVGNWGEMGNTKFKSNGDFRKLALALDDATGNSMCLSVRTPAQWRAVTMGGNDTDLASRMGLYNDGMFGNDMDYGTYGGMGREAGLAFQEELCASVPNGGEATNDNDRYPSVTDNPYSDLERAVHDMGVMHVTYLNREHYGPVLEKWKNTVVSSNDCYNEMNGFDYISRHLGYRLLTDGMTVSRKAPPQGIEVSVDFRNVGFAPLYTSPEVMLVLLDETGREVMSRSMEHNLTALSGGPNASDIGAAQVTIPLEDLADGTYSVYIDLEDPVSGMPILLANEQERGDDGYFLGIIAVSTDDGFALSYMGGTRSGTFAAARASRWS